MRSMFFSINKIFNFFSEKLQLSNKISEINNKYFYFIGLLLWIIYIYHIYTDFLLDFFDYIDLYIDYTLVFPFVVLVSLLILVSMGTTFIWTPILILDYVIKLLKHLFKKIN